MTEACHPDRRTSVPCPKEVDQCRTIRRSHEEGFASFIGTSKMEGLVKREAMMIFPCYRHRRREMNHETKRPTGICKPHKEEYIIYSHFAMEDSWKREVMMIFPCYRHHRKEMNHGNEPTGICKARRHLQRWNDRRRTRDFPGHKSRICKKSYSSQ